MSLRAHVRQGAVLTLSILAIGAIGSCAAIAGLNDYSSTAPDSSVPVDSSTRPDSAIATDAGKDPSMDGSSGDAFMSDDRGGPGADAPLGRLITFIQTNAASAMNAGTAEVSFLNDVASGDAILVIADYSDSFSPTPVITDTLGSTFQVVLGPYSADDFTFVIAMALNTGAGPDAVTLALQSMPGMSSSYIELYALEYSGLALTNAFDVGATGTGTTALIKSDPATLTGGNELVVAYALCQGNVINSGVGFAARSNFNGNLIEDMIAASSGIHTATAMETVQNGNSATPWLILMGAFKGQ